MKVLYFHQHFNTPSGTVGIRSYEMAKRLVARGHQVTMVCGSYKGGATGLTNKFVNRCRRGAVDGFEVIELELAYSNSDNFLKRTNIFLAFAIRSIKLAFTEKYDVLFATSTPLTAGIPGIFSRWFRGKPFIFEVRDLWPELPKAMGVIRNPLIINAMSLLEWLSYKSANRLVGLSPGIVEGIAKRGISKSHIELIPNGCDNNIFSPDVDSWKPERVTEKDLLAIYTGTHGIANGLNAVLDVAVELKKRKRKDIWLVLIGEGKLKGKLVERAKLEKLDNVIFLDGVSKLHLAGLLSGANIGMQILANIPSFYFGTSPNKFFDYLAAGLPVLNNYPGWLADMINENRCGFAIEPDNSIAFADALEIAADDRQSLIGMGENSRILAETKFDRINLSNKFVDCIESVLK